MNWHGEGVDQNYGEAAEWYDEAAEHRNGNAVFELVKH